MYKAIIFDLFGTLVETFSKNDYVEQLTLMSNELKVDKHLFSHYWNKETYEQRMTGVYRTIEENIEDICSRLNINLDYTNIKKAVNIRFEFAKKSLSKIRNGAEYTLSQLKNNNYKIGLISDCSPDVPTLWNDFILAKYFDTVIFSCDVKIKKPNGQIYHIACNELNINPRECFYVGDGGSQELTGAKNVGMYPILIRSKDDENKITFKQDGEEWEGHKIYELEELLSISLKNTASSKNEQ